MQALRKELLTEQEFLDAIAGIYREGGYDAMTVHGAARVQVSRGHIERVLETTPYLEPGSVAHITHAAA